VCGSSRTVSSVLREPDTELLGVVLDEADESLSLLDEGVALPL